MKMNRSNASIIRSSSSSSSFATILPLIGFLMMMMALNFGVTRAQMDSSPSPAPLPPSNNGSAIDQGIAYVLLLVALALTYLLH